MTLDTIQLIIVILAFIVLIEPAFIMVIALLALYISLLIPAILVTIMYRTGILYQTRFYKALDWYTNWAMGTVDWINTRFRDRP